jgi:DNA-binding transcriptional regulator YbjK
MSKRLCQEWRGGYYYAARPKNDLKSPLGLLYVSRWSNAEKAAEFAEIYARSLGQRYKQAEELRDSSNASADRTQERKVELLQGRHVWTTEEGAVVIEQHGDTVLVSESLDPVTTQTLEKEIFAK